MHPPQAVSGTHQPSRCIQWAKQVPACLAREPLQQRRKQADNLQQHVIGQQATGRLSADAQPACAQLAAKLVTWQLVDQGILSIDT